MQMHNCYSLILAWDTVAVIAPQDDCVSSSRMILRKMYNDRVIQNEGGGDMRSHRSVEIFGVPMDLGQSRRGVDMGPSAVRYAHLQERLIQMGYEARDEGNIRVLQIGRAHV